MAQTNIVAHFPLPKLFFGGGWFLLCCFVLVGGALLRFNTSIYALGAVIVTSEPTPTLTLFLPPEHIASFDTQQPFTIEIPAHTLTLTDVTVMQEPMIVATRDVTSGGEWAANTAVFASPSVVQIVATTTIPADLLATSPQLYNARIEVGQKPLMNLFLANDS